MEVHLNPEQEAFIQKAIEAGRINDPGEAVQHALALWEERERRRTEILAALDLAEASLARGEGIEITPESMQELSQRIAHRGRERLAAEKGRSI
jgi:putative addiction module CopG family antidote